MNVNSLFSSINERDELKSINKALGLIYYDDASSIGIRKISWWHLAPVVFAIFTIRKDALKWDVIVVQWSTHFFWQTTVLKKWCLTILVLTKHTSPTTGSKICNKSSWNIEKKSSQASKWIYGCLGQFWGNQKQLQQVDLVMVINSKSLGTALRHPLHLDHLTLLLFPKLFWVIGSDLVLLPMVVVIIR